MLNKEKIELLQWMQNQNAYISLNKMEALSAPHFNRTRVDELRSDGYLNRSIEIENGETVGVYKISDKGRAILQEHSSIAHGKVVSWVQYCITTAIATAALVLSVISIAMRLY